MTIKSLLFGLPLVLAGWLATLVVVGLVSDDAPAQVVVLPSESFMENLPESAAILRLDEWSVTLVSNEAGFVYSLYQSGAKLVLPAGLQGCGRKV